MILLVVFFGFIFLCPGLRYYYWGDETRQVIPLTISLWHDLKSGTFGFWNWQMGFGASNAIQFLAYLGSPTFWLLLLLPDAGMIPDVLPLTTILSLSLAAVFSFLWLRNLVKDETARFAGTVIMTFCGWAVFQFHYYSYLDAWMYLCLLLYVMEENLQGRKKLLFPVVIALITILDLFTMYMASWLILFYLTARLVMIHGKLSFGTYLKKLAGPFGYYLLGLGMAGAVFVMDAVILLTSGRVGGGSSRGFLSPELFLLTPGGLFRLVTSLFSPVLNDYDFNLFSSPFQEGTIRTYALFSYSFMITPLLLPQLLRTRIRELKPVRSTLLGLSFCALVPLFYYLFNGNQASRWCFYLVVFHVLAVVFLLEHREELDIALLKRSCIGCVILLAGFSLIGLLLHTTANRKALVMIVPFLMLALGGYTVSIVRRNTKLFRTVLMLEALLCIAVRIVNGTTITIGTGERAEAYETALLDTSVVKQIQEADPGFYRISTDEETAENYLLPMAKHFRGNSFYFSVFNPASASYYHRRISEDWFLPYLPSKFLSYGVFGNIWIIQTDPESFVPHGYSLYAETEDASGNPVRIYHRETANALGYADSRRINAAYAEEVDRSLQDYLLASGILCEQGTLTPGSDSRFIDLGPVNNTVLEYDFAVPGTLFIDYSSTEPSGEGSYELYRDGEVITYAEFSEYGYHAVRVEEPCDAVGIYVHHAFFTAAPVEAHAYWIEDRALDALAKERETLDPLVFRAEQRGNITAEITITGSEKLVATSVPYDQGWTVYADGQKIEPEVVNTSFIGFVLPKGRHEIRFVYTPRGMYAGIALSGISILLYAVLLIRELRRSHAV